MAFVCAILVPPGVLVVLMGLMALEAEHTFGTRVQFLGG
jgi:cytochrome c oxidase subunit IV